MLAPNSPFSQTLKLWGTAPSGGNSGDGVIYTMNNDGSNYNVVHSFDNQTEGSTPMGSLLLATNGKLYGLTRYGGVENNGTLYEFNPLTYTHTKLVDMQVMSTGANPWNSLIQANNGKLYGVCKSAGGGSTATLFEYDIQGDVFDVKVYFNMNMGYEIYGGLVEHSNGIIYGLVSAGGTNGDGVIYKYDPGLDLYTKILDFDGLNNGSSPLGNMTEASNGKLYGTTKEGGAFNDGVLFEIDVTTDTYTKLYDFDNNDPVIGGWMTGSFVQDDSLGILYGVTNNGGTVNDGCIFEFNFLDTTLTSRVQLDVNTTGSSVFNMNQTLNGDYVLTTSNGGANFKGTVLIFNEITDTVEVKFDFIGTSGIFPHMSPIQGVNVPSTIYPLVAEAFPGPVSVIDSCDAFVLGSVTGGVGPYSYNWITQMNNVNSPVLMDACYGIHTLEVTDYFGDTDTVNYFVTDSANYIPPPNQTNNYVDTLYIESLNCSLDFNLPIDSLNITGLNFLYPDTLSSGDYWQIDFEYYQAGIGFADTDSIILDLNGTYLLMFYIYCPTKIASYIYDVMAEMNFPEITNIDEQESSQNVFIYPNPAIDLLNIITAKDASFIIYNVLGQTIEKGKLLSGTNQIDLKLDEGTYVILTEDSDGVFTSNKFIVTK